MRTVPPVICSAPGILLLGLCSVYCGYCYGQDSMLRPALNECTEQAVRFALSALLLLGVTRRSVAVTAALPVAAETVAAAVCVWLFRRTFPYLKRSADKALVRQLWQLSSPLALARLCATGMRTLNAVLLPVCLRRSGLSAAAATAQFGLLSGMVMPLLMLPGIVTGAICMVAAPAVSRLEDAPIRLRCTSSKLLWGSAAVGSAAGVLLFLGADFISTRLYAEPTLAPLLRLMCPAALLMALQQVQFGLITGLGLQRRALTATIATSVISLLLTALLCPMPSVRLAGAALATLLTALVRVIWNQAILHSDIHRSTGKIDS